MDKWVPFADLRNARPFAPAYQIGETDVFGATFSGHEKELREAFHKLDGRNCPRVMWDMRSGPLTVCL